jgi:glycosyltransferase involved in cell wall biosynthesis
MRGIWLILHLDAKKRGTMEQQLVALARRLEQEKVPTTMVFARPPGPFPGDALREAGVDLRHLDFALPAHPIARELWSWMRAERPRIAHFHFIDPYSPLVVAARLAGARVLIHDHLALSRGDPLRAAWKRVRSLLLNGLFHERVAVSSFVARTIREAHHVPASRVSVVYNGVDTLRFETADGRRIREELRLGDAPLIVSIARLDDEKGGEWLLRALPRVGRGAHLAMVGEGPRLEAWLALCSSLGIASRVHFLGLRQDVEELLAAASVVVAPSVCDEGFGLAPLEGMAAGKPVVVTDSGPMPEIVEGAGLVVPKRDAPALAEAIDRLLLNDVLARKLGEGGRLRARTVYGMDRYVEQLLSVYRRHLLPTAAASARPEPSAPRRPAGAS